MSDVWSFGITLWELTSLCQQKPWSLLSETQLLASVIQRYHTPEASLNSSGCSGSTTSSASGIGNTSASGGCTQMITHSRAQLNQSSEIIEL